MKVGYHCFLSFYSMLLVNSYAAFEVLSGTVAKPVILGEASWQTIQVSTEGLSFTPAVDSAIQGHQT